MTVIDEKKYNFEKAISHLKGELNSIRTGRANPTLVENIIVNYYGTKTPLQQLANISVPDTRYIIIQPWDKNTIKDIEKSINASDLGLNPINEGNIIRIVIPALTEERRKDLSKVVHQKIEETRVSIRNIREEVWRTIKDKKTSSEITEDDMFQQQKELQKVIDEYNEKIKTMGDEKEKEIMTI